MKLTKIKHRKKLNPDDGMIPLINIVFLMLIFFMVAGHIQTADQVKVKLPTSLSDKHKGDKAVMVTVSTNGEISFDRKLVKEQQLGELITQRFEASPNKQAFSLLVKVDQNLAIEKLRAILSIIKKTGIKRVALATQQVSS